MDAGGGGGGGKGGGFRARVGGRPWGETCVACVGALEFQSKLKGVCARWKSHLQVQAPLGIRAA